MNRTKHQGGSPREAAASLCGRRTTGRRQEGPPLPGGQQRAWQGQGKLGRGVPGWVSLSPPAQEVDESAPFPARETGSEGLGGQGHTAEELRLS